MNTKSSEVVTFVATFDASKESKDGYYLNGYVINIDHAEAKRLNGKRIRVTGQVTTIDGLDKHEELDAKGNPIVKQGRSSDTRHLLTPRVEIVE